LHVADGCAGPVLGRRMTPGSGGRDLARSGLLFIGRLGRCLYHPLPACFPFS
jgi:hypothetical protein